MCLVYIFFERMFFTRDKFHVDLRYQSPTHRSTPCHTILHQTTPHTTLHHITPHHTTPHHTTPYHTTLHHTTPYYTKLHHTPHHTWVHGFKPFPVPSRIYIVSNPPEHLFNISVRFCEFTYEDTGQQDWLANRSINLPIHLMDRQTDRHKQIDWLLDSQTDKQTDGQMDRHVGGPEEMTDRQAGRQAV